MSEALQLRTIVVDFARGIEAADAKRPRSKRWRPGIGFHDERDVIKLVVSEMCTMHPERYSAHRVEVPYRNSTERCDICIGDPPEDWAIEVKALRMLGDKGIVVQGRDDVSKILSPYPKQRSAVTDCVKLASSRFGSRRAILIYAYDHPEYPMLDLVEAFELLAGMRVSIGPRYAEAFDGLIHPVHADGSVFAWEIRDQLSG